jgi:hypothetical protein
VWDAGGGALAHTLRGFTGFVSFLAAAPDAGLVAGCEVAGRAGGGGALGDANLGFLLRVWEVAGGAPAAVLHGHSGEVNMLAWDPGCVYCPRAAHKKKAQPALPNPKPSAP